MTFTLACPPSLSHEPAGRVGSYVDDVGEVAERIGRRLEPEQLAAVDVLTEIGRASCRERVYSSV